MKIFIYILVILINTEYIHSQVYQEWIDIYDGTQNNHSYSKRLNFDSNGNLYMLGGNNSAGTGSDITLIKYSQEKKIIWIAKYNGPGNENDWSSNMLIDNNNIYIVGRSPGAGTGVDYVTLKYDSSGNQIWVRRYTSDGNRRDAAYDLAQDNLGNIIVTGESYNNNTNKYDCVTIKYDSSGNQIWLSRYQNGDSKGFAITTDNYGNIFVAGRVRGDFLTIKYDSEGIIQWISTYSFSTSSEDVANRIGIDTQGNIYVAGNSNGNPVHYDYAIVKYDSLGEEQWVRRYNGSANFDDHLSDMKIDFLGNIYVTGHATQIGRGYDYTTIKYNTNGEMLWITFYHNGLNDIATALTLDSSGSVYVIGYSDGSGTGFDLATVKYDSFGNQKWVIRYNYAPSYDENGRAIAIDSENNIYVTGVSYVWGHSNVVTIKYNQTMTGVYPSFTFIPSEFTLYQNYPNPFNPSTVISYSIPSNVKGEKSEVRMIVYDALGKEVTILVNENKPAGSYTVKFEGSNFSSGIYFYRLEAGGEIIDTKRMVLLK